MLSPPESYTEVYKQIFYRGGYLFLQSIYYQMQMNKICRKLKQRYKFKYDINAILSDLIYAWILEPYSKRSSYKATSEFLEKTNYSNGAVHGWRRDSSYLLPLPGKRKRADIAEPAGEESPWRFRMPEIYLLQ